MVKLAEEVMIVLMAFNQITRMVISNFFPGESKNSISKIIIHPVINIYPKANDNSIQRFMVIVNANDFLVGRCVGQSNSVFRTNVIE